MKRYFELVLCLVFSLGFISIVYLSIAYSQDEAPIIEGPAGGEIIPEVAQLIEESVSGEIVSIDLEKYIIILKALQDEATPSYEEKVIRIDTAVMVNKNKAALGITDLAVGDKVTAECLKNEGGELVATSIVISQSTKR